MDTETMLNVLQDKKVKRLEEQLAHERATILNFASHYGELDTHVKKVEAENQRLRDAIAEMLGEVALAHEDVPDELYTRLRKITEGHTHP